jgi:hypothetical protein
MVQILGDMVVVHCIMLPKTAPITTEVGRVNEEAVAPPHTQRLQSNLAVRAPTRLAGEILLPTLEGLPPHPSSPSQKT